MDKLFLVHTLKQLHTHTHTACFVSTASCGRISAASSSVALATGSKKRERGLTAGPRHSLGCFCVDGAEGGGIMPFHVSKHRHDAMYLSGEILKYKRNKRRQN